MRAACSDTWVFRRQSFLACTHIGRVSKQTTLHSAKLNKRYENVSFHSEFALAFKIQAFKVAFFVNLNTNI